MIYFLLGLCLLVAVLMKKNKKLDEYKDQLLQTQADAMKAMVETNCKLSDKLSSLFEVAEEAEEADLIEKAFGEMAKEDREEAFATATKGSNAAVVMFRKCEAVERAIVDELGSDSKLAQKLKAILS